MNQFLSPSLIFFVIVQIFHESLEHGHGGVRVHQQVHKESYAGPGGQTNVAYSVYSVNSKDGNKAAAVLYQAHGGGGNAAVYQAHSGGGNTVVYQAHSAGGTGNAVFVAHKGGGGNAVVVGNGMGGAGGPGTNAVVVGGHRPRHHKSGVSGSNERKHGERKRGSGERRHVSGQRRSGSGEKRRGSKESRSDSYSESGSGERRHGHRSGETRHRGKGSGSGSGEKRRGGHRREGEPLFKNQHNSGGGASTGGGNVNHQRHQGGGSTGKVAAGYVVFFGQTGGTGSGSGSGVGSGSGNPPGGHTVFHHQRAGNQQGSGTYGGGGGNGDQDGSGQGQGSDGSGAGNYQGQGNRGGKNRSGSSEENNNREGAGQGAGTAQGESGQAASSCPPGSNPNGNNGAYYVYSPSNTWKTAVVNWFGIFNIVVTQPSKGGSPNAQTGTGRTDGAGGGNGGGYVTGAGGAGGGGGGIPGNQGNYASSGNQYGGSPYGSGGDDSSRSSAGYGSGRAGVDGGGEEGKPSSSNYAAGGGREAGGGDSGTSGSSGSGIAGSGGSSGNGTKFMSMDDLPVPAQVFAYLGTIFGCQSSKVFAEFFKLYKMNKAAKPVLRPNDPLYSADESWMKELTVGEVNTESPSSVTVQQAETELKELETEDQHLMKEGEEQMPIVMQIFIRFIKVRGCMDVELQNYIEFNSILSQEIRNINANDRMYPSRYYTAKADTTVYGLFQDTIANPSG